MPGLADIARAAGIPKQAAEQVFEEIISRVANGEKVNIKAFGAFSRGVSKGRKMSTPLINDGKAFKFPSRYNIKFKASTLAKRRINVVAKRRAADEAHRERIRRKKTKEEG